MSWGFKAFDSVTKQGTDAFVVLDRSAPEGVRTHSLRDDYDAVEELALPDQVPQSVRDYFDGTRMLWLHGWFYYPFYSMAAVHSYLCVELALKERLRGGGVILPKRQRTFAGMLGFAIDHGWFSPAGFGTIRRQVERGDRIAREEAEALGIPIASNPDRESQLHEYMTRLFGHLRYFRNVSAHPDGLTLLLPNMTYTQIEFARDAISQLFTDIPSAV